ncbi:HD-GYP domain-containing protein [Paenibacillus sambharensis]|uniref:HD-GYP domain-containing protein n=1 Tax=Paenibacillus sambharensis TaxID=1803190 RepID=A0A2W1LQV1_9BACL|nr:HD domain-containing phosphohydrolase [Paenibacillus sambharensis]PZD94221.1 HD-GYP domain-containing protein [Paenibacillus sambharensis]
MRTENYEDLIGKEVLHNIFDAKGTLLIAEGTILLKSHIEKLVNFNIAVGEIQTVRIPEQEPKPMDLQDMVKRTEKHMQEIDSFVHQHGVVPVEAIEEKVLPVIMKAAERHNLFQLFTELKDQGDYRYRHSIGTAVIATSLGKRLLHDEGELATLATAASLYDIGSLKLPSFLIQKSSRLDHHEIAIMQEHTRLGYELLIESGLGERIAQVALQHHEREDGSGYPNGLKGGQIDQLSKIVAIADVYMAMISERPYRPAVAFFEVMEEIHQEIMQNRFDSAIGLTFLDLLLSAQVGCEVILSDERRGKIMLTNVNYPARPLIALEGGVFIDLSTTNDVTIKEVVG